MELLRRLIHGGAAPGPAALAAAFLSYHIFVAVGCVIVAQRNLSAFWVYRRPSPAALRRNLQIAGAGVGAWLSAIADTTVAVWSLGPSAVAAYTRGNSLVQSSLGGVMSAGYQASAPGLRAHTGAMTATTNDSVSSWENRWKSVQRLLRWSCYSQRR